MPSQRRAATQAAFISQQQHEPRAFYMHVVVDHHLQAELHVVKGREHQAQHQHVVTGLAIQSSTAVMRRAEQADHGAMNQSVSGTRATRSPARPTSDARRTSPRRARAPARAGSRITVTRMSREAFASRFRHRRSLSPPDRRSRPAPCTRAVAITTAQPLRWYSRFSKPVAGIPHQMPDAGEQVVEQRDGPAEQQQPADRRTEETLAPWPKASAPSPPLPATTPAAACRPTARCR